MNKIADDLYWKERNIEYLNSVQRFLDKVDNIVDEKLKQDIICAMMRCDDILTKLAQNEIIKYKK